MGTQRQHVLRPVARAVEGHLDEGRHARRQLDQRRELGDRADEERVGLEGGHVDPAGAPILVLDDEAADGVDLRRDGVARAEGDLGHREGEVRQKVDQNV